MQSEFMEVIYSFSFIRNYSTKLTFGKSHDIRGNFEEELGSKVVFMGAIVLH